MRIAVALAPLAIAAMLGAASAAHAAETDPVVQRGVTSPPFYINTQARFAIMFPGNTQPMVTQINYQTKGGKTYPARRFSVVDGRNEYRVTVVDFATGAAVDPAIVQDAVNTVIGAGKVIHEEAAEYEPGVGSRQLMASLPDGRQVQASVYMWDHHLHITEAIGMPGVPSLLRFAQSVTLFGADGGEVNVDSGRPRR